MHDVVREDLDEEAYQTKPVFAGYGLASYQARVLERGLANVLTLARTQATQGNRHDFDGFLEEHLQVTMGRLVTLLGPHIADGDALLVKLREALQERNRLAHRFFASTSSTSDRSQGASRCWPSYLLVPNFSRMSMPGFVP